MNQSEKTGALFSAVLAVQTAIDPVVKDAENPYFKSKYAARDSVLAAVKAACQAHGLCVSQWPADKGMVTHLSHPDSGEWKEIYVSFEWDKIGPQAHGAYLTYMSRYALCTIFLIELPDDDGASATTQPEKNNGGKATAGKRQEPGKKIFDGLLKSLNATEKAEDRPAALGGWAAEHGAAAKALGGDYAQSLGKRFVVLEKLYRE